MNEREVARLANLVPDMFRDRVSATAMKSIDEDIWAGEWALGLDDLVGELIGNDVPVTLEEYELLQSLEHVMRYPQQMNDVRIVAERIG